MSASSLLHVVVAASVLAACSSGETPSDQGPPASDAGELDGGGHAGDGGPLVDGATRDGTVNAMRDSRVSVLCGNAALDTGEQCDDGNRDPSDGCSEICEVESGYECKVPGDRCALSVVCGDNKIGPNENCDDGNTMGGDGCSADCHAVETGFNCATPGAQCISTVVCGDKHVVGTEQCDDGNVAAGDGCGATCQLEAGFACQVAGVACRAAKCGDGLRVGAELCDDGNETPGDGCGATCLLEEKFVCSKDGSGKDVCQATQCGDKKVEGSEQCDDGNDRPYDGCLNCVLEPSCMNSACTSACGDGIKFPDEACDDGNTRSGDGCSATCLAELGFACNDATVNPGDTLDIPIILRDLIGHDQTPTNPNIHSHLDFENHNGGESGLVGVSGMESGYLGMDKKPVYAKADNTSSTTSTKVNFARWYNDDAAYNRTVVDKLTFNKSGTSYVYQNPNFFPLDGRGWSSDNTELTAGRPGKHNFSFTSELRYWFEYRGGEVLNFTGDDDVWVYVNGMLAVDLGGVHGASNGSVTLTATAGANAKYGLQVGKIYEVVVFQAERHTSASSYTLTLNGFVKAKTSCLSHCGDGIVTADEVCDDGKNDGSYGSCMAGCQDFGPHCGDAKVDPSEQCDLGLNLGGHNGCTAECKIGPRCGDGNVDGMYGEMCDDGKNDGSYGTCAPGCVLGPRCGDHVVQSGELCDDGNSVAFDGCDNACMSTLVI